MNNQNPHSASGQMPNIINLPPNASNSSLNTNKIINNNKPINNSLQDKNSINTNRNINNIQESNNNINYVFKNLTKICCTCTRTQCQKKYCACFSRGIYCQGCDCKECLNVPKENTAVIPEGQEAYSTPKEEEINTPRNICQETKMQATVCNCTKSRCMKKYCECFKMNIACGNLCRCIECQNKNNIQNIYQNLDINNNDKSINNVNNSIDFNKNVNDVQKNDTKNDYIEKLKEISKSFTINAMGIHITNRKLIVQERNIDLNKNKINLNTTPKLTNKKRARGNNSNQRTCPTTVSTTRRRRKGYSQVNSNVKTKKLNLN